MSWVWTPLQSHSWLREKMWDWLPKAGVTFVAPQWRLSCLLIHMCRGEGENTKKKWNKKAYFSEPGYETVTFAGVVWGRGRKDTLQIVIRRMDGAAGMLMYFRDNSAMVWVENIVTRKRKKKNKTAFLWILQLWSCGNKQALLRWRLALVQNIWNRLWSLEARQKYYGAFHCFMSCRQAYVKSDTTEEVVRIRKHCYYSVFCNRSHVQKTVDFVVFIIPLLSFFTLDIDNNFWLTYKRAADVHWKWLCRAHKQPPTTMQHFTLFRIWSTWQQKWNIQYWFNHLQLSTVFFIRKSFKCAEGRSAYAWNLFTPLCRCLECNNCTLAPKREPICFTC